MPFTFPPVTADDALALLALLGLASALMLVLTWRRTDTAAPGLATPSPLRHIVESRPAPAAAPAAAPEPRDEGPQADAANSRAAIAAGGFEKARLLRREEAQILPYIEDIVRRCGFRHRVVVKASLGDVVRPAVRPGAGRGTGVTHGPALAALAARRLDFVIIDGTGAIAAAIECLPTTENRVEAYRDDDITREVLRKAGVPARAVDLDFNRIELEAWLSPILAAGDPAAARAAALADGAPASSLAPPRTSFH